MSSGVATATSTEYGTAPSTKLDSFSLSTSPSQTPTESQSISPTNGGFGDTSGIAGGGGAVTVKFSDLLMNGGVAAGIGLFVTISILYFVALRRRQRSVSILTSARTATSKATLTTPSFSVTNPLKEQSRLGQRPQAPLSKPPKSAKKSYAETVKDEKYKF